jgi:hypothetical protein
MPVHDSAADSQANSRSIIVFSRMQALEHGKNSSRVRIGNANAVVPDLDIPVVTAGRRRDVYAGLTLITKLDAVADQVLEQLDKLRSISINLRQLASRHLCASLRDRRLQIRDGMVDHLSALQLAAGVCCRRKF